MKFSVALDNKRRRFLKAVNSLERATGIPVRCDLELESRSNGVWCSIFVTDEDSAKILSNLMSQVIMGKHTEKYYRNHPEQDLRETLKCEKIAPNIYRVGFSLEDAVLAERTEQVEKMAEKLIAPSEGYAKRPGSILSKY